MVYNDEMMDIFIVSATNRRQLIKYLLKLIKGNHKDYKRVEHIRTNKFTLMCNEAIDGNLDGEALNNKKFEMNVIPKAMTFYYNKKLTNLIYKELDK